MSFFHSLFALFGLSSASTPSSVMSLHNENTRPLVAAKRRWRGLSSRTGSRAASKRSPHLSQKKRRIMRRRTQNFSY